MKNNRLISRIKIINYLLLKGNKRIAEKKFLETLKLIQHSSNKDSKNIFKFAIINKAPFLNIKVKKRKKKIVREIPFIFKSSLRTPYAIKEIIKAARKKKESSFPILLRSEIFNSFTVNNENLKQKNEIYKKSFSKKAFSHFRWF